MKGKHRIVIQNNRLHYDFEIRRNISIIQGDSASGKTTLINMLRQAENLGPSSGVDVVCDVPCRVLEGQSWRLILENSFGNIYFIDEENSFINTEEFAASVRGSDNYFVLITRENLYNLPYSVEEIYGLHASGKYHDAKKVYQQTYQIYPNAEGIPIKPKKIITEDSNAGYEFFWNVSKEQGILCESADGKSNIFAALSGVGNEEVCVVADGAAIGPEMNRLYHEAIKKKNIHLYLPESFEWIILNSGLVGGKGVRKILESPEEYIDSQEFLSWERYFARLLADKTAGSYLQYKKSKLNQTYLHEKSKSIILDGIKGIKFTGREQ